MYPMYTAMVYVIITKKRKKKMTIIAPFSELRCQIAEEVEVQNNGTISPRTCPFLR